MIVSAIISFLLAAINIPYAMDGSSFNAVCVFFCFCCGLISLVKDGRDE